MINLQGEKSSFNEFYISGNTPSSKNNRVWTGTFFVASDLTKKWRKITVNEWGNKKVRVFKEWELETLGDEFRGYFSHEVLMDKKYEWGGGQRLVFQYALSLSEPPIHLLMTFIRKSKHRFDYINLAQSILDEMVEHDWIPDDCTDYIIPYFAPYIYDRDNPGTLIHLIKEPKYDLQTFY